MEQEILPCRICGGRAEVNEFLHNFYICTNCSHDIQGPNMPTQEEAIAEWNKMMVTTEVPAEVELIGTSYRDRVDRMVSSQMAGFFANPAINRVKWDHEVAARFAIKALDAVDVEIAKQEAMK